MELIKAFIEETNYVVGRMLLEYNSYGDEKDESSLKKWSAMSTALTIFIQDIKVDERIPDILGASTVSALHSAYQTGKSKVFMHEINMHLMTMFNAEEFKQASTVLGCAYFRAMQCTAVDSTVPITQEEAVQIFSRNLWLISLYVIRMNYFTPIVGVVQGENRNEA